MTALAEAQCSAPWMLLLLAIALTLWSWRNWTGSNKLEDINVTFSRYNRKLAYLTTAQSATYTHAIVVGESLSEVEMYGNAFGSIFERELFEAFAWGIELMELR
ncbi:hypothetical protein QR685DRAFT_597104 [Neurospora intermedia]|uniref:Uncharacterized protein n=1 Tax=Neurospora intermedia TaxID=5142 RepID=A0ABR3DCT4_NEUIN